MDIPDPSGNPPQVPARIIKSSALVPSAGPSAAAHDEAGPAINLGVIMRAVSRHWWQILAIWSVLSVASLFAIQKYVWPNYRASGVLRVQPDPGDLFLTGFRATENFENYLETQVNLITNPDVLRAVANDPVAQTFARIRNSEDAAEELRRSLKVYVIPKTQLIEVAATTKSPIESSQLANLVIEKYLRSSEASAASATDKEKLALKDYQKELDTRLQKAQDALLELAKKSGIDSNTASIVQDDDAKKPVNTAINEITREQYRGYQNELLKTTFELTAAETELATRKASLTPGFDKAALKKKWIDRAFNKDPEVQEVRAAMEAAEKRIAHVNGLSRMKNDISTRTHRNELETLNDRLYELWQEKYPELNEQVSSSLTKDGIDNDLKQLQAKIIALQSFKKAYEDRLEKISFDNKQETGNQVQMAFAQEDIKAIRTMNDTLQRRLEEMEFSSRNDARITKRSDAFPPGLPVSDYRTKLMVGAPFGLICLVAGFFMVVEIRAGRVGDPDDLASRARVEIIGVLPPLPTARPARMLGFSNRPHEDRLEAFVQSLDHLRVSLCGESHETGRCVVITSAVGGEGKTTLSVQLAARCAHAGVSTVLVDADLRRASLSKLLDSGEVAGLSDVLQGDLDLESALTVVGQAGGFHLLPAGTPGVDPGRLLEGRNVGQLIAKLRQSFDVVIIDSPPVLPVPDALTLSRWADGAVLAVRLDNSRFPLVEQANRRLIGAGIVVLGAVVNGVPSSLTSYNGTNYSTYSANDRNNGHRSVAS